MESLENRSLMAVDLQYHNELIAEDVNQDFKVSPIDALLVINALNKARSGASGEGEGEGGGRTFKTDVSGDGVISPLDALLVINRLNAEGEGGVAKYEVEFVNTSGAVITQTSVGQTFRVNVYVTDLLNAIPNKGVVSASVDLDLRVSGGLLPVPDLVTQGRVVFNPEFATSRFSAVGALGSDEEYNEVSAFLDGDLVVVPNEIAGRQLFFSSDIIAKAAGTLIVEPNIAEAGADDTILINDPLGLIGRLSAPANAGQNQVNLTSTAGLTVGRQVVVRERGVADETFTVSAIAGNLVTLSGNLTRSYSTEAGVRAAAQGGISGDLREVLRSEIEFVPGSILIQADPTSPVAVNDTATTAEDTAIILAGTGSTLTPALTANDTRFTGREISVTSLSLIPSVSQGTISGLTYTPPANFFGTDTILYTITDTNGLTSSATVTITVTPVNDAPTAVNDPATGLISGTENEPVTIAISTLLANDSPGPNEASQTLSISSVSTTSGSVAIVGSNVVYTPVENATGEQTFSYVVTDNGTPALTASATVRVNLEPAVRPFARRDTASTTEISAGQAQTGVAINVLQNDAVNPGATPVLVTFAATSTGGGTITRNADNTLQYVPAFEFNGADFFTYTMNDSAGTGANSTTTVTVNVADVNDAPTAGNDTIPASASILEDTPVTIPISTLLTNDSPGLGESTTQTLTVTPGTSANGTVAVVGQNVVFTPAAAVNGLQTFTYTVTDSGTPALSATATVTVTLAAVNDAPIAGVDQVTTDEDTQLVVTTASLLLNDAAGRPTAVANDESGQTLSITAVARPATTTGSVSLVGGNITYVPALNFNGTETFTYTVLDSAGASSTGTVTVTVNPINDAPIAGTDSVVAFKGVALQIPVADLLGNDVAGPSDELGQTPLTITGVSGAVNGTVSLNSTTGIITFTPASDFSGAASFRYTVQDSGPTASANAKNVNSGSGTVNVTVRDFVPTKVSGKVWVDDTQDGVIDGAERKLGGVEVTLTGSALGIPITPRSYITLADGSYHFDNLAPGQYVVQFAMPAYFSSAFSADSPGALGDADSFDNQFTINVAQPGGGDGSNYNFAISGLETKHLGLFSSLLASNFMGNPANIRRGIEATLGDDNSSIWISKLEGFDEMVAGEVVVNSTGNRVQLTMVDASERIFTATLMPSQFRVVTDNATGNRLVRIFGDARSINFQQISLAAPPVVSFNRYLEAIDEIFAQEGWDGLI